MGAHRWSGRALFGWRPDGPPVKNSRRDIVNAIFLDHVGRLSGQEHVPGYLGNDHVESGERIQPTQLPLLAPNVIRQMRPGTRWSSRDLAARSHSSGETSSGETQEGTLSGRTQVLPERLSDQLGRRDAFGGRPFGELVAELRIEPHRLD